MPISSQDAPNKTITEIITNGVFITFGNDLWLAISFVNAAKMIINTVRNNILPSKY